MAKPEDLIGKIFGRLYVEKIDHKEQTYNKKQGQKTGMFIFTNVHVLAVIKL